MSVTVGPTYCEVTIDPSVAKLIFPDTVCGSIRPGSLDHLSKLKTIVWGINMTDLIEPGTIPDAVTLVLRSEYRHQVDTSKLGLRVRVWIHGSNYQYAPTDRCFRVWADRLQMFPVGRKITCTHKYQHPRIPLMDSNWASDMGVKRFLDFSGSYVTASDVPHQPHLEETQATLNQEFVDLSHKSPFSKISKFIDANLPYLRLGYQDYAVLKTFIERHDLELCVLLHTKLGPIHATVLQSLLESLASTDQLEFVLDFADAIKVCPIIADNKYLDILYKVCSSDAKLDVAKRVYNMWSTPNPYKAFAASCTSWNEEKIDYFLEICEQLKTPNSVDISTAVSGVVCSGNLYAFNRMLSVFVIDWTVMINTYNTSIGENCLIGVIAAAASERTGMMVTEMIKQLSISACAFTKENIDMHKLDCTFWDQYASIMPVICRSDHINAIQFFLPVMKPTREQLEQFIKKAGPISVAAVEAIIAIA